MSEEYDEITGPGELGEDDAGVVTPVLDEEEAEVAEDDVVTDEIDPLLAQDPDAEDSEEKKTDFDPEEEDYFFQNFEGRE